MNAQATKQRHGKLIWVCSRTGHVSVIKTGPFALLQDHRRTIENDPQYAHGFFKLKYL